MKSGRVGFAKEGEAPAGPKLVRNTRLGGSLALPLHQKLVRNTRLGRSLALPALGWHIAWYHVLRRMELMMYFPIAIHKDADSDYGVTVPDLPVCFSAGSTIDEAMLMAREAIELHLDVLIEDGREVPVPSDIESLRSNPDLVDAIWAIVSI